MYCVVNKLINVLLNKGSTHTLVTPLDLIKCRMQVDANRYKNIQHGFQVRHFYTLSINFIIDYYVYFIQICRLHIKKEAY